LLKVSRACKIPVNKQIFRILLFASFQEIHAGCCTVAAHERR
jgi:hypothetical protein